MFQLCVSQMGTSNSQWREAVGHWSGDVSFHTDPCSSAWGQEQHTTAHWSPIGLLTSLLVIGGVELNPGPNSSQVNALYHQKMFQTKLVSTR